jgi:hypothetical protein
MPQPDDDSAFRAALAADEMIIRDVIREQGEAGSFSWAQGVLFDYDIALGRPQYERLRTEVLGEAGSGSMAAAAMAAPTATTTPTTTTTTATSAPDETETRTQHMAQTEKRQRIIATLEKLGPSVDYTQVRKALAAEGVSLPHPTYTRYRRKLYGDGAEAAQVQRGGVSVMPAAPAVTATPAAVAGNGDGADDAALLLSSLAALLRLAGSKARLRRLLDALDG